MLLDGHAWKNAVIQMERVEVYGQKWESLGNMSFARWGHCHAGTGVVAVVPPSNTAIMSHGYGLLTVDLFTFPPPSFTSGYFSPPSTTRTWISVLRSREIFTVTVVFIKLRSTKS
jgi:hypothetical protein